MSWPIIILGIVIGMNVVAIIAELVMHDREKLKELKLKMKEKQDRIKELSKKKDAASMKAMMDANKELFSLTGQQMKMSFRSMLITFPIFGLIFLWLSSQDFSNVVFPLAGGWWLYYIMTYFIVTAVMAPLKNHLLWGHWRGAVYAEKTKEKNG